MAVTRKDLGIATAYGYAKSKGYTGTEEEFALLMKSYTDVAEEAREAADDAEDARDAITAMGVSCETLEPGSPATVQKIVDGLGTVTLKFGIPEGADGDVTGDVIADEYSSSKTYAVGDHVMKSGHYYVCNTAITTAEAWTSAHWTEVAVGDEVTDLKGAITELNSIVVIEVGQNLNNPETQTVGYYIAWSGNLTEAPLYDVSDFIPIEVGKTYSIGVYNANNALFRTRTLYAFYDDNKNLVGTITNTDNTLGLLATAPQGASFIRISGHTHFSSDVYNLMLAESSTILTTFVQYSETKILNPEIEVNGVSELEPLIGTVVFKIGENLYDPSKSVSGFLNYNGAIETVEGQNYSTSALIPVEPNTNYYVKGFNNSFLPSNTRLIAACYNESENLVSNTYVNENAASSIVINPQNYPYIRVCANAELAGRHLMVTKGEVATDFVEYVGGEYTTLKVENDNLPFESTLYGKKWVVCGDSFTNSGGTGTTVPDGLYKGRPYTYPWIIGNRQNMDIIKFFEGGRTLAFPAEPGTFTNSLTNPNADWYYQNIPEDVDYITIYLGINDEHHATGSGDGEDPTGVIQLGTIDDETTATYYGAWNVVLTWLITNRPNAHIGIIVTNGLAIEGYRTAQIAIARKYGIPFIDLNGDDRTPAMLRTVNPNIPSTIKQALITKWAVDPTGAGGTINTHPNDAAQEFESTFIENFLRSI